jgi:hypothetical protein
MEGVDHSSLVNEDVAEGKKGRDIRDNEKKKNQTSPRYLCIFSTHQILIALTLHETNPLQAGLKISGLTPQEHGSDSQS